MHYQVVARTYHPGSAWSYYPYWAPSHDASATERLAQYAAQCGYEAAIVHSVTVEMLEAIVRRLVERQDAEMLPATRFLPSPTASAIDRQRRLEQVTTALSSPYSWPHTDRWCTFDLDRRRLELELGSGGDVTKSAAWHPSKLNFPRRMDVLSDWLRLRRRLQAGQMGGSADGGPL